MGFKSYVAALIKLYTTINFLFAGLLCNLTKFKLYIAKNLYVKPFSICLGNILKSAGIEPFLSHTEKSCTVPISDNFPEILI